LLCGAAGILRGRRATTHWAAFDLLPFFGAIPVDSPVVVEGKLISAAGVTAGIDGALTLVSLLCGDELAQRIQLSMEYAPAPPFQAGSPRTAPPEIFRSVTAEFRELTESRRVTVERVAARLGMKKAGPCEPAK
jgi:cyclohexyl-isocyanide hydratase